MPADEKVLELLPYIYDAQEHVQENSDKMKEISSCLHTLQENHRKVLSDLDMQRKKMIQDFNDVEQESCDVFLQRKKHLNMVLQQLRSNNFSLKALLSEISGASKTTHTPIDSDFMKHKFLTLFKESKVEIDTSAFSNLNLISATQQPHCFGYLQCCTLLPIDLQVPESQMQFNCLENCGVRVESSKKVDMLAKKYLKCIMKGPEEVTTQIETISTDETKLYVTFQPTVAGMYWLSITLYGIPVNGSPLALEVKEQHCSATAVGDSSCWQTCEKDDDLPQIRLKGAAELYPNDIFESDDDDDTDFPDPRPPLRRPLVFQPEAASLPELSSANLQDIGNLTDLLQALETTVTNNNVEPLNTNLNLTDVLKTIPATTTSQLNECHLDTIPERDEDCTGFQPEFVSTSKASTVMLPGQATDVISPVKDDSAVFEDDSADDRLFLTGLALPTKNSGATPKKHRTDSAQSKTPDLETSTSSQKTVHYRLSVEENKEEEPNKQLSPGKLPSVNSWSPIHGLASPAFSTDSSSSLKSGTSSPKCSPPKGVAVTTDKIKEEQCSMQMSADFQQRDTLPLVNSWSSLHGERVFQFGKGSLKTPIGISSSGDKVYIADTGNHLVRVLDINGEHIGKLEGFFRPSALAVLHDGNLVVHDDIQLHVFSPEFKLLKSFGEGLLQKRSFGLAINEKNEILTIQVTRSVKGFGTPTSHKILAFNSDGSLSSSASIPSITDMKSKCRFMAAYKSMIGIVDLGTNFVFICDMQGKLIKKIGGTGRGDGQFNDPAGITFDTTGNLLVADSRNHRIQVFDASFNFVTKLSLSHRLIRPSGIYLSPDNKHLLVNNYWENTTYLFFLKFK